MQNDKLVEEIVTPQVHWDSVVVDGLNAVYPKDLDQKYVQNLKKGGISAIHLTIPDIEAFSLQYVVSELAELFYRIRSLSPQKVRLATTVRDIREEKKEGGLAVLLGSQGAGFLGLDLKNLDFYYALGMRVMQPTYQRRNQFGSGCEEVRDDGLSILGREWVERMNELGMLISLSHVGYRTSMDVLEISKDPVVFDHSNPKAVCDHARNITDEQIRACADQGGVIGLCPAASFVDKDKDVTKIGVEDFIKHIDYVVNLVGVDHVGLGLDIADEYSYTREQLLEYMRAFPTLSGSTIRKVEDEFLASGREKLYLYEMETPWLKSVSETPIITQALLQNGYTQRDLKKILGENFLRVFEKVFVA